jgi:hypothetical protein
VEAVILVSVAALIALVAWYAWYARKRRREDLALAARQLGLQYAQGDPFGLLGLPFDLLRRGDGRGTENVLWGTWQGMDVTEFDYWYYEESTDSEGRTSRTYHRFSCAVSQVGLTGTHLTVSPENLFTRLADHVGFRDIEFELEEFNREFQVKSPDRKFATDVIDQRMMRWLLQHGGRFSFELNGPYLMCFSKRRRPQELVPLLGTLKAFGEQIPRVAFTLYGAPPKGTSDFLP